MFFWHKKICYSTTFADFQMKQKAHDKKRDIYSVVKDFM